MNSERYSRQTILTEIGVAGQKKIGQAVIAIVGMGALGTGAADLLVRAGIGALILIDRDVVEESNLQRQTLYEEKDVGKSKVVAAKEKMEKINDNSGIKIHAIHLNAGNIEILRKRLNRPLTLAEKILLGQHFCRQ